MISILILIIGLILFVGLVVAHELGHAIVAARNGVEVEEFGVGFPPSFWSKKLKNGTILSLNWLPLGGFVKLKGEHDSAEGPGTYGGANLWVKTKILLAGVVMNWLAAVLIFTILALTGLPQLLPDQFTIAGDTSISQHDVIATMVIKDSPADKAGIKNNDRIIKFDGQPVVTAQNMLDLTSSHSGRTVDIVYEHQGATKSTQVTLNKNRIPNQGYLGIQPDEEILRRSTWSAPIVGAGVTAQFTAMTFQGLVTTVGHLIHQQYHEAGQGVAGPVGIFTILQRSSELGLTPVLFLISIISLTLAVMNTLPIPALDGGRLFVTLLFRIFRGNLTKKREEIIQGAGFVGLMLLVLLITVIDVGRIIGK